MNVSLDELNIVGNTNGEEVICSACKESWENTWIIEEGIPSGDVELNQLILDSQHDDPDGEKTRISGLTYCPCCDMGDSPGW